VTLGAIAARTERITLGTWISAPATYQPWRLALAASSLDQLSNGRVMLGVGLGLGSDFGQFGDEASPGDRARRYDEALEVIQLLWSGEPVTFLGEFFRLEGVTLPVVPRQERDDAEYRSLAHEVGATWLLTSYRMDLDELRKGPPT